MFVPIAAGAFGEAELSVKAARGIVPLPAKTMPEISIIISTYNRLERLKRAIKSVEEQTFKDWELIIADDGSTDGTQKWASSLKSERIKYLRVEHFGSDTKPKNEGIKIASGKYVCFLDDDNEYRKDALMVLYNAIKDEKEPVLVYGMRMVVDDTKQYAPAIGKTSEPNYQYLFLRNYIDFGEMITQRENIIAVGGIDESLKKFVDWNLWVRMVKNGVKLKKVNAIIQEYHMHSEMKSVKVKTPIVNGLFEPTFDPANCEVNVGYLREKRKPKVAVYTLTWNRLNLTKQMWKALKENTKYPFDWFVVDQASTDGTADWLKGKVKEYLVNNNNVGISKGSNQAVAEILKGDYDIVFKIDNDTIMKTDSWLERIVDVWERNKMLALSPYIEGLRDNPGGAPRIGYTTIGKEYLGITRHLGGCFIGVSRRAYEGWKWNEKTFLHGVQDLEFSKHLLENRYMLAYLEGIRAEHNTQEQEERLKDYFEQRAKAKQTKYEG